MPRKKFIEDDDNDDNDNGGGGYNYGKRGTSRKRVVNNDDDDDNDGSAYNHDSFLYPEEKPPTLFQIYFPNDVYQQSVLNKYLTIFESHFESFKDTYNLQSKEGIASYVLTIDIGKMLDLILNIKEREFIEESLYNQPTFTISVMEMAAHEIYLKGEKHIGTRINIRIINHSISISLRKLKANSIGKFVSVKGTVVKVSTIKPVVTQMIFTCQKCGAKQKCYFKDGQYNPPSKCNGLNSCKSKSFIPERNSAITLDWQKIRIQEIVEGDDYEAGRIPRTIECEITEDLVESCVPGDEVVVCGTVKVISTDQHSAELFGRSGGGGKGTKCMYFLYLEGNSITNTKATSDNSKQNVNEDSQQPQHSQYDNIQSFSDGDLEMIYGIACENKLFRLLVHSLCPAIFGHEVVKAGLLLTLFGGVQRYTNAKDMLTVRGDPHILVVGDPGLGKSQLLTAVSHVAPRGIYVCGNTTSTSGLTVTVTKDSASGDFSLEAGALVLADRGCCCIDEFDKMSNEHQALLEAMEQQSISIAKAGIVCNLPARCSVAAAANPVGGHYNRAKTVGENLKINPALLSRFDLIFILLDKPDELKDQLLSEHVLKLHSNEKESVNLTFITKHDMTQATMNLTQSASTHINLKKTLKFGKQEKIDPVPPPLLRKYIAYARKYCQPVLSLEAKKILQEFYITLRKSHHSAEATPITTRQLESLIRLAQARARSELRSIVTEEDALDVVDIMKESMFDVLTDEKGRIDLTRVNGMSKTKQQNAFIEYLTKLADSGHGSIFTSNYLVQIAQQMGVDDPNLLMDRLNNQGYLIKQASQKGEKLFKLSTSSAPATPKKQKTKRVIHQEEDEEEEEGISEDIYLFNLKEAKKFTKLNIKSNNYNIYPILNYDDVYLVLIDYKINGEKEDKDLLKLMERLQNLQLIDVDFLF
ncbi:hypothetical protein ABK040_009733 [Willaertia magna]